PERDRDAGRTHLDLASERLNDRAPGHLLEDRSGLGGSRKPAKSAVEAYLVGSIAIEAVSLLVNDAHNCVQQRVTIQRKWIARTLGRVLSGGITCWRGASRKQRLDLVSVRPQFVLGAALKKSSKRNDLVGVDSCLESGLQLRDLGARGVNLGLLVRDLRLERLVLGLPLVLNLGLSGLNRVVLLNPILCCLSVSLGDLVTRPLGERALVLGLVGRSLVRSRIRHR